MNDFDDDRLRDEFDRRAGGDVSIAAAHDAVLARAGHIRRRRAAVTGTGALVALLVGGLVLLPRAGGDSLTPADSRLPVPTVEGLTDSTMSTTVTDDGNADVTTSTTPSTSTTVLPAVAPPVTAVRGSAATSPPGGSPTTRPSPPPTPTTSSGTASTAATSGSTATTTPTSSSTASSSSSSVPSATKPSVAPFTRTYDSAGGSITVDWDGDSFTLLSVAPAGGFSSEIEDQQATRIRVRFRGDTGDARIEVRVNNGQLIVDIS